MIRPKRALGHARQHALDQRDRRQHVRLEPAQDILARDLGELGGGGPPLLLTRMSGAGQAASSTSRTLASPRSPSDSRSLRRRSRANLLRRRLEAVASRPLTTTWQPARGQFHRAGPAQALARGADDRLATCNAQIHGKTSSYCLGGFRPRRTPSRRPSRARRPCCHRDDMRIWHTDLERSVPENARGGLGQDPDGAMSLSHDLHVRPASRHARLSGRSDARFPAPQRRGHDLPGRRHHRRLAAAHRLVLAAGAQRRHPEAAAQGAARRAHGFRAGQSRRVRAPVHRTDVRRHRDRAQHDPRHRGRQALLRHARRRIRRRRAPLQVARLSRRLGLRHGAVHQYPFQRRAPCFSASTIGRSRPGRSSR